MVDVPLQIQQLRQSNDRVLALAELVSQRAEGGWAAPVEINAAFEAFRLPPPSNTSQALAQLRTRGLVVRRRNGGGWALTPKGRQALVELLGESTLTVPGPTDFSSGAQLFHAIHALIPPFFAPVKWATGIKAFLQRYPFDNNVFCMTRFPSADGTPDPVKSAIEAIRESLKPHGLVLHLASDRKIDDDLWGNVAAHGWASRYGIALFEDRVERGLNYNLVAEVGAMLMTGRRCALLKDTTQHSMPTDFVGLIYTEVDFEDLNAVTQVTHAWAARDLGLGTCSLCKEAP
jgi:hypothetical protein